MNKRSEADIPKKMRNIVPDFVSYPNLDYSKKDGEIQRYRPKKEV